MNKVARWCVSGAVSIGAVAGIGNVYKYVYWRTAIQPLEKQIAACASFDEITNAVMSSSLSPIDVCQYSKWTECRDIGNLDHSGRAFSCKFTWCKYLKPACESILVTECNSVQRSMNCKSKVEIFRFRVPLHGCDGFVVGNNPLCGHGWLDE